MEPRVHVYLADTSSVGVAFVLLQNFMAVHEISQEEKEKNFVVISFFLFSVTASRTLKLSVHR